MDEREKEIRLVLAGQVGFEDGIAYAVEGVLNRQFCGFNSGYTEARFRKLVSDGHQFHVDRKMDTVLEQCLQQMAGAGQRVSILSSPMEPAVLVRLWWAPPVLVSLIAEEKEILLRYYTARTPFARFAILSVRKKLKKLFPEGPKEVDITLVQEQTPAQQETPLEKEEKEKKNSRKPRKVKVTTPDRAAEKPVAEPMAKEPEDPDSPDDGKELSAEIEESREPEIG